MSEARSDKAVDPAVVPFFFSRVFRASAPLTLAQSRIHGP